VQLREVTLAAPLRTQRHAGAGGYEQEFDFISQGVNTLHDAFAAL